MRPGVVWLKLAPMKPVELFDLSSEVAVVIGLAIVLVLLGLAAAWNMF